MSTTTTSDVYNSTTASTGAQNAEDATSSNIWTTTGISTSNSIPCANYYGNVLLRSNFNNQDDTLGVGSLVSNNSPMVYIIFQASSANDTGTYFTIPVVGSIPNYKNVINYQLSTSEISEFLKTNGTKGAKAKEVSDVIHTLYSQTVDISYNSISIDVDYTQSLVLPIYLVMPGVGIKVYDKNDYKGNVILDFVNNNTYPICVRASNNNETQTVNDQSCEVYFISQNHNNGKYSQGLKIQDYGDTTGSSSTSSESSSNTQYVVNSWESTGNSGYSVCLSSISNLLVGQSFEKPGLQNGSGSSLNTNSPGAYFIVFSTYYLDDEGKIYPQDPNIGQCYYVPIFTSIENCTNQVYSSPSNNDLNNSFYRVNGTLGAIGSTVNSGDVGTVVIPTGYWPTLFLIMPNYGLQVFDSNNNLQMDIINQYPFPIVVCGNNPKANVKINLYYVHFDTSGNFLESILIQNQNDYTGTSSESTYAGREEFTMEWFNTATGSSGNIDNLTYSGVNQYSLVPNKGNLTIGQNFEYPGNSGGWGSILARNIPGAYMFIQDTFKASGSTTYYYIPVSGSEYIYVPGGYFSLPITSSIKNYQSYVFNSYVGDNSAGYYPYKTNGDSGIIYKGVTNLEVVGQSTPSAIYYLIMPNFGLKVFETNNYGGSKLLDLVNNTPVPILVQSQSSSEDQSCELYYCQMKNNGSYTGTEYILLPENS